MREVYLRAARNEFSLLFVRFVMIVVLITISCSTYAQKKNSGASSKPEDIPVHAIPVGNGLFATKEDISKAFDKKFRKLSICLNDLLQPGERDFDSIIGDCMAIFNYDEKVIVRTQTKGDKVQHKTVRDYLRKIHSLRHKYRYIDLVYSKLKFVTPTSKGGDGILRGSFTILQVFVARDKENRIVYHDTTKKTFNFNVSSQVLKEDGYSQKNWTIFLSDIFVNETPR